MKYFLFIKKIWINERYLPTMQKSVFYNNQPKERSGFNKRYVKCFLALSANNKWSFNSDEDDLKMMAATLPIYFNLIIQF